MYIMVAPEYGADWKYTSLSYPYLSGIINALHIVHE